MKGVSVGILLFLLAACGNSAPNAQPKEETMQAAAKVAERNLVKIRDGVLACYRKNGTPPASMDDLEPFGVAASKLEPSEDYSELGYHFYSVEFNKDGAMTLGWFEASPMEGRKAYRVRMNGVTGEFDHANGDERYTPAPGANAANAK